MENYKRQRMTKEDAIAILNREKVATVAERNEAIDMAIDALENERPKGKWLFVDFDNVDRSWDKCSICGFMSSYKRNFCSNCGADMRGGEEE